MTKALVVERHGDMRRALCNLLVGMGIDTVAVKAVEELDIDSYEFDIIISNESSVKYLSFYEIPVLVLTSSNKEDDNNISYLRQPFEIGDFILKIENLLLQTQT